MMKEGPLSVAKGAMLADRGLLVTEMTQHSGSRFSD